MWSQAPHMQQYGTHHTKMMLLFSAKGLRVVVSTANMHNRDWNTMTNAVWVSPLFPPRRAGVPKQDRSDEAPNTLGADLVEYLAAYQGPRSPLNETYGKTPLFVHLSGGSFAHFTTL